MTLPELVEALEARDIKLSLRLVVDTPRGVLTDAIKTALAAHKPASWHASGGMPNGNTWPPGAGDRP